MTFQCTNDTALIREVMTHPKVYPYITDDGAPSAGEFRPTIQPGILYLLCFDAEELLGLWMFVTSNAVTAEVHTCLLPGHGYRRSRTAAKQAAEWIWENTQVQRIFTNVPSFNRVALNFAKAAGMQQFGVNEASFQKHGKLHDQVLLGMSRPKGTECQQR